MHGKARSQITSHAGAEVAVDGGFGSRPCENSAWVKVRRHASAMALTSNVLQNYFHDQNEQY